MPTGPFSGSENQDYIAGLANIINTGPTAQPVYQGSQQQPSGWEGKGGQALNIADHFLAGLSRGRALAYQRSQEHNQQTFGALSDAMQRVQTSDLPDNIKQQQLAQLGEMRGNVFMQAIGGDSKSSKGGKGKQGAGQEQGGPGHHILNAVKGIATSMLGPGAQKQAYEPEAIKARLHDTNQLLANSGQLAAQQTAQLDQGVTQALAPIMKNTGGQLPTYSQAIADPNFVVALGKNIQTNGGKPTPAVAGMVQAMQAREKEQADLTKEVAKDTAAEGRQESRDKAAMERQESRDKAAQQREDSKEKAAAAKQAERDKLDGILKRAEATKNYAEADLARQRIKTLTVSDAFDSKPDDPKTAAKLVSKAASNPALDLAAWNYLANDKFDTRGLGHDAHADVAAIRARAGQIMGQLGYSPGDVLELRAGLRSNMSALSKVTTQAAQIEQFESTLQKNLDILTNLDAEYKRGNVQLLNRVQNAFNKGVGDTEALNLAAQLHGTSREWAKIMAGNTSASGVAISDSRETDEILNKAMSSGQLNSLVEKVIRPDAKNRTDANNEEMQNIRGRIRGIVPTETPPGGAQGTQPPPQTARGTATPPAAAARNTNSPPAPGKKQDPLGILQ